MNILVLEAAALHLGYLGCYGNEWIATPNLDALAADGIVFDQHHADLLGATPRTSWTGRYFLPCPDAAAPPPLANLLAACLQVGGVAFDLVRDEECDPAKGFDPESLDRTLDRTLRVLESRHGQGGRATGPTLLWVDLPSLAPPWTVPAECLDPYFPQGPPEEGEIALSPWLDPPIGPIDTSDDASFLRLQATYAGVVSCLDTRLGLFWEEMYERKLLDDLLICFTAGAGLPLGEHGIVGDCRPWLHDELIHLPLIFRWPDEFEAGRRVLALTQPVDLLPTLLSILGLSIPPQLDGHDLSPLIRGERNSVRDELAAGYRLGERIEWALRTPEWVMLLPVRQAADDPPRSAQLYGKPDDRWEVNDLAPRMGDRIDEMAATLRALSARMNSTR